MKALAILLLSCLPAFAQSPLLTASGIDWTKASASSDPDPATIPGLWYYWNSADLTPSATFTNWKDRIQGLVWTNGNNAALPTIASSGVVFDGVVSKLTNAMTFAGAPNFITAFIVFKCQRNNANFDGFFTDIPGNSNQGLCIGNFNGPSEVMVPNTLVGYWLQPVNVVQDWILPFGSINGTGGANAYTNNILAKTLPTTIFGGTAGFALAQTQAGGAPGKFTISVIAIYTNNLSDVLTNASYRTTLHTWATNDSPQKPFAP